MMSKVKRYTVEQPQMLQHLEHHSLGTVERVVVHASEFDRVTAERDVLQQRLNATDQRIDEFQNEREKLIAYGRSCGLDEASTLCSRMSHDAYFPPGTRFKHFTPKAQARLGNLLIEAANAIASLPDGPYDRFIARQQKKAGAAPVVS